MADLPRLRVENHQGALALRQGGEDRGPDPLAVLFLGHYPVDDRLYEMYLVAVHSRSHVPQRPEFSVYPDIGQPLFQQAVEQFTVMSLAALDQRRQNNALAPGILLHDQLHDAGVGVFYHRLAGHGRIGRRCPGVEQAEKVGYLGDGAYGRTGVAVGALLLYGNGRAEAFDALHFRTFHHPDVMPRIGRQGIHVPASRLRIYGIERQRRLAAAAQTRDHHEGVARYSQGNILEVVDRGLADIYVLAFLHPDVMRSAAESARPGPGLSAGGLSPWKLYLRERDSSSSPVRHR